MLTIKNPPDEIEPFLITDHFPLFVVSCMALKREYQNLQKYLLRPNSENLHPQKFPAILWGAVCAKSVIFSFYINYSNLLYIIVQLYHAYYIYHVHTIYIMYTVYIMYILYISCTYYIYHVHTIYIMYMYSNYIYHVHTIYVLCILYIISCTYYYISSIYYINQTKKHLQCERCQDCQEKKSAILYISCI